MTEKEAAARRFVDDGDGVRFTGPGGKTVEKGAFTIAKSDEDQRLVFGWSNVAISKTGEQVCDLQGDVIDPEELEKAAYDHVLNFRSTGERHDPGLRRKGRLVESCVFTKEKQAAMGIPPGLVHEGWWVGYKIDDPTAWEKIKKGEYRMFSIEGKGQRTPIEKGLVAKSYEELRKFNPYHGADGRFSSRDGHTRFSPGKNEAQASRSIANENARRAAEGMDQLVSGAYSTIGKVEYGSALKGYLDEKAKQKDPIQQTAAPDKAGKSVKWSQMTDDEFAQNLEKYMPGITDIATKGWAGTHSHSDWEDSGLNGDMVLTDIYTARGYHGAPQVVDKATIKAYIAQNGTPELYRGMGASSHGQTGDQKMDRFIGDPLHFAGYGVLGNGTYAAQTPANSPHYGRNPGLRVARAYAGRGGTGAQVRMTLEKGAKTVSYPTLHRQQQEFISSLRSAISAGKIDATVGRTMQSIVYDAGRFGALRGYDAWYDKSGRYSGANSRNPFWVVTNRSKLMIQEEVSLMIDMIENEVVGTAMPVIREGYGAEQTAALVDAIRGVEKLSELDEPFRAMVEYGITNTDYRTGRPKKNRKKPVKKAMTYGQARGGRFFDRGGATPGKTAVGYAALRKYNPYHAADGKFSSKNGFKTYSADRKIAKPWGEGGSLMEHLDPATGKISKERVAEYNRIINKFLGDVEPPADGKPTLDYMGGGGGSGKSYTIAQGVVKVPGADKAVQINADDIKLEFKEFRERAASPDPAISMGAAAYVHEESSKVASLLTKAAMARGVNIVIDGVASKPDKVGREIAQARQEGYGTIRAHYIATPMDVALQSSRDRYFNNKKLDERRYVPDDVLVEAHRAVSANFSKLAGLYDEVEVVTNDRKSAPKQIAHKKAGGELVVTDRAAFDQFLGKANYSTPTK